MEVVVIALIAIVIAAAVVGWVLERKRREALRQAAAALGLEYHEDDPFDLASRYEYLDALRQGSNRYALNVMNGMWNGHDVTLFDYHYETHTQSKHGRQTHHHYFCAATLRLPLAFPELRVRPEGLLDKLGDLVGFDDIDFESIEFSRAYRVKSRDRKFAYDVFHPRMMELFLEHPGIVMEIERDTLMLMESGKLRPEDVRPWLELLVRVRENLPAYLLDR